MSDAEKKEAIELQTTVRLNLAACLLKVEKPQRAVEELDLVWFSLFCDSTRL